MSLFDSHLSTSIQKNKLSSTCFQTEHGAGGKLGLLLLGICIIQGVLNKLYIEGLCPDAQLTPFPLYQML